MTKNNLLALAELGQSPWYDNIDRRLIQSGDFRKLLDKGVTGVTSNPSIFEKAIKGSAVYNKTIEELVKKGRSPEEIYDVVTVQDVQIAADFLRETYERTQGLDGYVSLEVLPRYAQDPEKTIENARRLSQEVGRKNLMIKVPGTVEGAEAIRVLTADGININVTLLFSMAQYERSAKAYMEGLRDRLRKGKPLDQVCSVASLFVSRVDTVTDKQLQELHEQDLQGKIAVANAKMIYQRFKEWFTGEHFSELASEGARIQRVLWGSTSTKNPDYYDLKYVDELIGKETINTLPHNTLLAFLDHGNPRLTLEEDLDKERGYLEKLKGFGIDLNQNCEVLQQQGVQAFSDSFNQLIDAIVAKTR
ncbi:MAG: transaldolase [Thermodesulfobacteriota bacterium]|nr:transaldolase [Thermodesulfobacteriota bacterium]